MKYGENQARLARTRFLAYRDVVLAGVAIERTTPAAAMKLLERRYARQTQEFLRLPTTTYGEWLEHGPRGDLVELRAGRVDDSLWDRLVDQAFERRASRSERAA